MFPFSRTAPPPQRGAGWGGGGVLTLMVHAAASLAWCQQDGADDLMACGFALLFYHILTLDLALCWKVSRKPSREWASQSTPLNRLWYGTKVGTFDILFPSPRSHHPLLLLHQVTFAVRLPRSLARACRFMGHDDLVTLLLRQFLCRPGGGAFVL